jgi:hypothetical protein
VLLGSRCQCAVVQQAHPEKLANAELAESLRCFYLGGLLQALNRFLGHFVVLFSIGPSGALPAYMQVASHLSLPEALCSKSFEICEFLPMRNVDCLGRAELALI